MTTSGIDSGKSEVRIVLGDPELAKKVIGEKVDNGIDKVAGVTKDLIKEGIQAFSTAAPAISDAVKPLATAGVTVLTHSYPSVTPIAVSVTEVVVEKSVKSTADYSVENSLPRVDSSVDSSAASVKKGAHQSVDKSVDLSVSSVQSVKAVFKRNGSSEE